MASIPDAFLDLFERKSHATFVTMNPDGTPHGTVVWIDYDGEYVLVNTARGRRKERNVQQNPNVSVTIIDPENPYRYLSVTGTVRTLREEGAETQMNELGMRYEGVENYMDRFDQDHTRVLFEIEPEEVIPVVAD